MALSQLLVDLQIGARNSIFGVTAGKPHHGKHAWRMPIIDRKEIDAVFGRRSTALLGGVLLLMCPRVTRPAACSRSRLLAGQETGRPGLYVAGGGVPFWYPPGRRRLAGPSWDYHVARRQLRTANLYACHQDDDERQCDRVATVAAQCTGALRVPCYIRPHIPGSRRRQQYLTSR